MVIATLLIRRAKSGNAIWLKARKETAEFYGWTKHFEPWAPGQRYDEATGLEYIASPTLKRSQVRGGRSLVISRSASKSGRKATYSNQFRISGEATIPDIAKVAQFTDVDWNWMETPSGERRTREEWLSIHQAWTQ